MFIPIKSDTGALIPWEYMPAEAGEYKVGQILAVEEGKVKALTGEEKGIPAYLCMCEKTADEDEVLPVTRIHTDYIYETELSAEMTGAKIGTKCSVASTGLAVSETEGAFELVSVEGTAKGSKVRGRFVPGAAAASEAV